MGENMKKLSLKTREGCTRLIAIFIIVILLSGFIARAFQNDFGNIKVEQVSFDSRGAILNAELYYPAGTNDTDSLPAIVVTHGGGCTLGVTKGIAAEFARRGFVVLNVSAYGTGLSDQPIYDEADQGVDGFNMMQAINGLYDALCYIRTLRFVDATRIGTVGHSMGAMRTFAAAVLDAGYLSVNDTMLNTLYEEFGIEISADQVNSDADALAEESLTADQLAHYYTIKETVEEHYNTRVKAEVALGIGAGSTAMDATVEVAGHEVTRGVQTNFAFVTGDFDSLWGFTDNENARAGWNAPDGFNQDEWYAIDDATNSSVSLGSFDTESIVSNSELAEAIDNRTTRALLSTGEETHSKEFFSQGTIDVLVNYFSQTMNYNRGNLTDSSTQPLASTNQIWMYRAVFNFIALLAMFGLLFSLGSLLLKTKTFAACVSSDKAVARPKLNKPVYWVMSLVTVALGFVAIYLANKNGLFFFDQSPFLPLGRTAVLTVYFLLLLTIGSLVIMAVSVIMNKKSCGVTGLANLNIKVPVMSFVKCLLFSILLIIVGYSCLAVSEYLFGQDFRLWMTALSDMKVEWWTLGLHYVILLFPLYFVLSGAVNLTIRTDIPEWKDTLITVIINSVGVWLCCLVNYIIMKTSYDGTLFSSFICSYQFVLWVPITTYIARKMYNLTKNVWSGAMINTFIIVWSMMSSLGVNDTYWGPNWISNFFNV